jgi:hypothetical protein
MMIAWGLKTFRSASFLASKFDAQISAGRGAAAK